jgi:hypothetical protein
MGASLPGFLLLGTTRKWRNAAIMSAPWGTSGLNVLAASSTGFDPEAEIGERRVTPNLGVVRPCAQREIPDSASLIRGTCYWYRRGRMTSA